jgi:hypothetical protein
MGKIDFEEFAAFSDKLFPMVKELAEIKVPGAQMLCRSLIEIRREVELEKAKTLPLRQRVVALAALSNREGTEVGRLRVRLTDKYVGTCRDMDTWEDIGTVEELFARNGSKDTYEGGSRTLLVRVNSMNMDITVKKALKDIYTAHGCSCEHDCCGCVSQSVTKLYNLFANIWLVKLSWYANY